MTKYFKAKFLGIATRKSHQVAAGGKVQFFKPKFEFIELTEWQEVSISRLDEVKVGPYWEYKSTGLFGSSLNIYFKQGEQRFENQKLIKEVVLVPSFRDHDLSLRHVHDFVDGKQINSDFTRINGEAYFQITLPKEAPQAKIELNPRTGTIEIGGGSYTVGSSSSVVDERETNFTEFNTKVNERVVPRWNRWLNWILLLTGVGFISTLPWLGMGLLYYPLQQWSRSNQGESGPRISIFWLLLAMLVLGVAATLGSPYLWPLAIAYLLLVVVRKGAKRGWVIGAVVTFLLLAVLALLPLLTTRLTQNDEDTESSNVKTKREKKEGSDEVIARHSIEWAYPERNDSNLAQYATSDQEFTTSLANHAEVSQIQASDEMQFWNAAYKKLLRHDQEKVDSVADVVKTAAVQRNFTPLQTAEYLVTMIQEVPYVLVHDESCKDAVMKYKGFIAQYHMQGKPCLPNVVAGVQSPYEFMHTLKGDCDTRTLFAHAVLNRLGISSSVWVSSVYGHSILGVGVPGSSGNRKVIKGIPHYAVELTAKNFRIGMVAPDQSQMSNWNVAIYSNF